MLTQAQIRPLTEFRLEKDISPCDDTGASHSPSIQKNGAMKGITKFLHTPFNSTIQHRLLAPTKGILIPTGSGNGSGIFLPNKKHGHKTQAQT